MSFRSDPAVGHTTPTGSTTLDARGVHNRRRPWTAIFLGHHLRGPPDGVDGDDRPGDATARKRGQGERALMPSGKKNQEGPVHTTSTIARMLAGVSLLLWLVGPAGSASGQVVQQPQRPLQPSDINLCQPAPPVDMDTLSAGSLTVRGAENIGFEIVSDVAFEQAGGVILGATWNCDECIRECCWQRDLTGICDGAPWCCRRKCRIVSIASAEAKPDLVASILFCNPLEIRVANTGTGNAGPSTTRVKIVANEIPTNRDLPTPAIPSGGTVDLSLADTPGLCTGCEIQIFVTADFNNIVGESNEGNNTASGSCLRLPL
jgi:CARDB